MAFRSDSGLIESLHRFPLNLRVSIAFVFLCLLAFASGPLLPPALAVPTRVACVGDSIAFGSGTAVPGFDSYPAQLARMLGSEAWEVRNFGVGGATLLTKGEKPWTRETACQASLGYLPELVIVVLGRNDTKPQNWPFKTEFVADYRAAIGRFKALPSTPKILFADPFPFRSQAILRSTRRRSRNGSR